ncbi:MAG: hypothetical protein ACNS61_08065 [Candidatus Wenzhouxiangella sp. M2_3B_020]
MKNDSWVQKALVFAGPTVMVVVVFFVIDQRTEDNVRRMAEACEQMGQALQIEKISWGRGVQGECIPRTDR